MTLQSPQGKTWQYMLKGLKFNILLLFCPVFWFIANLKSAFYSLFLSSKRLQEYGIGVFFLLKPVGSTNTDFTCNNVLSTNVLKLFKRAFEKKSLHKILKL